eukprot:7413993-Alexandrium_andersonii.AAC.1
MVRRPVGGRCEGAPTSRGRLEPPLPTGRVGHSGAASAMPQPKLRYLHRCTRTRKPAESCQFR